MLKRLILILALGGALVACGGDGSGSGTSPDAASPAASDMLPSDDVASPAAS
jgi:hypothetical protein